MSSQANSTQGSFNLDSTSLFQGSNPLDDPRIWSNLSSDEGQEEHSQSYNPDCSVPLAIVGEQSPIFSPPSDSDDQFINRTDHSVLESGSPHQAKNNGRKKFNNSQNKQLKGEQLELNIPILNIRSTFAEHTRRL